MVHHFKNIWYSVETMHLQGKIEFKIYRMNTLDDSGNISYRKSDYSLTNNIREVDSYVIGCIKQDGSSSWDIGAKPVISFFGIKHWLQLFELVKWMHEYAKRELDGDFSGSFESFKGPLE